MYYYGEKVGNILKIPNDKTQYKFSTDIQSKFLEDIKFISECFVTHHSY